MRAKSVLCYFQDILNLFCGEFVNPGCIWHLLREAVFYMGALMGATVTRQGSVTCHGYILDKWQS